ncbi:hypothetical protein ACQPTN_11070 [Bradyrhizobium sp. 13971]
MIAFFVPLAALCRLLEPCELSPRQHAAELLGKSDDGWVRGGLQGISTAAHFA